MTTDELVRALRETDMTEYCPCWYMDICKNEDCYIIQAADRLEELEKRVAIMSEHKEC
jgi:hypothetical protein